MSATTATTALDQAAFKHALAGFASGVTIVTAHDADGRRVGFTASSFASLSLDPPLILVCLGTRAECYPAFARAPHFAVSILAAGQEALARRFATKGIDKFAGLPLCRGDATGLPLIPGAAARLQCRTRDRFAGGDHVILVGEVIAADSDDRPPLLYLNRRYGGFAPALQGPLPPAAGQVTR